VKFDYVARETFANLRRNITLTIAAIVTVAVSLSLFGSTILLGQGVDNVSARWHDGIELIAFLKSDITPEQHDAIKAFLDDNPEVGNWEYIDLDESREEALRIFERNELMYQKIESGGTRVPDSYRVTPDSSDVDLMTVIGQQLASEPGVLSVTDVSDSVKTVTGVSNFARRAMLVVGVGLLVAALLLILNAIRMAMFARRREIEVMKLVGATNWFIRVPFMLEGLIQGLLGAAGACVAVVVLNNLVESRVTEGQSLAILQNFSVSSTEVNGTLFFLLLVGVLVGTIGSGVAVSRFLDV
jgi:cell division transport system permease protein